MKETKEKITTSHCALPKETTPLYFNGDLKRSGDCSKKHEMWKAMVISSSGLRMVASLFVIQNQLI